MDIPSRDVGTHYEWQVSTDSVSLILHTLAAAATTYRRLHGIPDSVPLPDTAVHIAQHGNVLTIRVAKR